MTGSRKEYGGMERLKQIENDLVPVYVTDTGEKVVYGTELFDKLDSKRQYTDWIKGRLSECEAVEGEDYQSFSQKNEKPQGGRPGLEYIIRLDTAKEMAMLERSEIGKQVRKYFIQVEKRYKQHGDRPEPALTGGTAHESSGGKHIQTGIRTEAAGRNIE